MVAAFIGGLGLGSSIAFLITEKSLKVSHLRNIHEVHEHYKKKEVQGVETLLKEEIEAVTDAYKGAVEDAADVMVKETPVPIRTFEGEGTNYSKIYNVEENEVDMAHTYVIDSEEFSRECAHHAKITYQYYAEDNTVADENDEIVLTPEDELGDALEHFGEDQEDPYVVRVRNNRLGIDFEVLKVDGSYSRDVLGHEGNDDGDEN